MALPRGVASEIARRVAGRRYGGNAGKVPFVIDVSEEMLEKDRGLGPSWINGVHLSTWLCLVLCWHWG